MYPKHQERSQDSRWRHRDYRAAYDFVLPRDSLSRGQISTHSRPLFYIPHSRNKRITQNMGRPGSLSRIFRLFRTPIPEPALNRPVATIQPVEIKTYGVRTVYGPTSAFQAWRLPRLHGKGRSFGSTRIQTF